MSGRRRQPHKGNSNQRMHASKSSGHGKAENNEHETKREEGLNQPKYSSSHTPSEPVGSGHSEIATAKPEKKMNIATRLWHAPIESKSVAINSILATLTLILALFAYKQWQAGRDSVNVAQKSLDVANAALSDSRASAQEASDRAERMTKANEALANAAKRQAETSLQIGRASEASASAAERSARTAQDSFTIEERPWVMIKGANYTEIKAGQSPTAILTIINTGNTPAFNVTTDTMINFRNTPVPMPMPIVPYAGEARSKSSIASKADMNIIITHKLTLTDEIINKLYASNYRLYVWGKIEYDDIFKKHHKTEFCGIQKMGTLNFDLCDNNNTAN